MTTQPPLRKPKLFFDTASNPSHVTFDDGREQRRNIPWLHYAEGRWDYGEPELIKLRIGECLVLLRGYNLGPLYAAIEERTLLRVRAYPEIGDKPEREPDTFVREIRFAKLPPKYSGLNHPAQIEFELGDGGLG
jgi:hypothetical protein